MILWSRRGEQAKIPGSCLVVYLLCSDVLEVDPSFSSVPSWPSLPSTSGACRMTWDSS
jgi:hypothetical protein